MLSEFDKRSWELGKVIGANGEGKRREGKRREKRRKWGMERRCKVDRLVGVFNSMISAEDDKPY